MQIGIQKLKSQRQIIISLAFLGPDFRRDDFFLKFFWLNPLE
jgi:hypothetical protein